jgi:hypothetical protein
MEGTVKPDHTVAERLAVLRHQHLARVVACLSLLIDVSYRRAAQRSWFVTGARDEIRAILEEAIRAEEPETRRLAHETANRLVARGHTQFGRSALVTAACLGRVDCPARWYLRSAVERGSGTRPGIRTQVRGLRLARRVANA